jgi:hypothetical protein
VFGTFVRAIATTKEAGPRLDLLPILTAGAYDDEETGDNEETDDRGA